MTDTVNVPCEAVERFKDALENLPDVMARHAKGQKFNAYDLDADGGSKAVCIGPITSRPLSLFAAPADVAELVEASLKLAAHALAAPKAEPVSHPAPSSDELLEALVDLASWFDKPVQGLLGPVWAIPSGEQGADDAVEAAQNLIAKHKGPQS